MYKRYRKVKSDGTPRCGTITSEPQINRFKTENENTVFELTGKATGRTITCVAWGVHLVEKDETVTVWGYETKNEKGNIVFIVNRLMRNYELKD